MSTALNRTLCEVSHLGLVAYEQAWKLQDRLAKEVAAGRRPPTLLLLEHPHCFTFGRRGRPEHLLWNEEQQAERAIEIHWIDRGGDVTYHGPGQLVGYPLLPLGTVDHSGRLPGADYVGYLRALEHTLIGAIARLGLVSGQVEGLTGVWIQPELASRCPACPPAARREPAKLASIGVKVDAAGISRHGFALNVNPDMTYWEGIQACGLPDHPAVSLEQLLGEAPKMDDVIEAVLDAFGQVFDYQLTWTPLGLEYY